MPQVKKPGRTVAIIAAGGMLGIGMLAGTTSAQAQPPKPTVKPVTDLVMKTFGATASSTADAYSASVRGYWTANRMRKAKSADTALDRAQVKRLTTDAARNAKTADKSTAAPMTTKAAGRRRRARRSQKRGREMSPVLRRSASSSDVIR